MTIREVAKIVEEVHKLEEEITRLKALCAWYCDELEHFRGILGSVDQKMADDAWTGETIEDGFGSAWSIWCPMCWRRSMQVVRPGKSQCMHCG